MGKHRSITSWEFDKMWWSYPATHIREELKRTIGGTVADNVCRPSAENERDDYHNTCAVRLSHALNCAGHILPPPKNNSGLYVEPGAGSRYFYAIRARELRNYFVLIYGTPLPIGKDEIGTILGLRGIMVFWWGGNVQHVDLWNGIEKRVRYNNECFLKEIQKIELWVTTMEIELSPPGFVAPDSPYKMHTAKPQT
jgi:hypothetical protein